MEQEPPSQSDDPSQEPAASPKQPGEPEEAPGEVRVRFGKFGAALFMVLGFAYQAFFNSAQSQTERITELGILMLVGFFLGWGFARLRF
ncbi:hypothetical protein [Gimesia fumaroli]|uniref:Uncharacterized protein n=1 Tax=Gimesia fumaroli TaxID=2527976 RepID=A0A518I510_9PLAN|nr:hypothetical protein [Gimesia fumaroli]QDV48157.1 hypothetical protein Enr17x_01660 [Gimesia fumaroli]